MLNTHIQEQIKYVAYITSWSTVLSPVFHKKLFPEYLNQFFTNSITNAANVIKWKFFIHLQIGSQQISIPYKM